MHDKLSQPLGATGLVAVINLDTLEGYLQFACTLAAFVWWARLWWNNPKTKPPKQLALGCLALILLAPGCAKYSSHQQDLSRYDGTNESRTVTTRAGGYTLFSGKNNLQKWTAFQSDKSQKAGIEGLGQESQFAAELDQLSRLLKTLQTLQGGKSLPTP